MQLGCLLGRICEAALKLLLCSGMRKLLMFLERRLVAFEVNGKSLLLGQFNRELNRESKGVIEAKCTFAGNNCIL